MPSSEELERWKKILIKNNTMAAAVAKHRETVGDQLRIEDVRAELKKRFGIISVDSVGSHKNKEEINSLFKNEKTGRHVFYADVRTRPKYRYSNFPMFKFGEFLGIMIGHTKGWIPALERSRTSKIPVLIIEAFKDGIYFLKVESHMEGNELFAKIRPSCAVRDDRGGEKDGAYLEVEKFLSIDKLPEVVNLNP